MNNNATVDKLQRFLSDSRSRKKLMAGFIIGFVVLCILGLLSNFSIVKVTFTNLVAADTSSVNVHAYNAALEKKSDITNILGLYLIPRTTESLVFTSAEAETTITPTSFPYGYSTINVELREPAKVEKVSSGGELCPVVNSTGVYSHNCTNPSSFTKYAGQANGIPKPVKILDFKGQYVSGQYKDGILAWYNESPARITTDKDAVVSYVVPGGGVSRTMTLPDAIKKSRSYTLLVTDTANRQNTGFVVYDYNAGIGYYYSDYLSTSPPKLIKRQYKLHNDTEASSCVLTGKIFACYHGPSSQDMHDSDNKPDPATKNEEPHGTGVVEITNMNTEAPSTKVYTAPDGTYVAVLSATVDGTLYGWSESSLNRIKLEDTTYSLSLISSNTELIAGGRYMYYVQDSKVYAYDVASNSSSLYFYDKDQGVTKIVPYDGGLLSLSYNFKDPLQLVNVYRLSSRQR